MTYYSYELPYDSTVIPLSGDQLCNEYANCENATVATHKFYAVVVEDVLQTMYRQEILQLNFISYYNCLVMHKQVSVIYRVHNILNVVCK